MRLFSLDAIVWIVEVNLLQTLHSCGLTLISSLFLFVAICNVLLFFSHITRLMKLQFASSETF